MTIRLPFEHQQARSTRDIRSALFEMGEPPILRDATLCEECAWFERAE